MTNSVTNNRILDEHVVSIVIPVYNAASYLSQCLDSVLGQTYRELDIVCVNDGSTDDSLKILREYAVKDSRIRIFSKENEGKGAASARNMGLHNAKGEYIQFLDSDDFFELDMVETLVTKALDTSAEVVICRGQTFDDEMQCVTGKLPHPDLHYAPDVDAFTWRDCPEYICEIADFYAWNKLFKRQLLIDHGLNFTPIPISDDQDISMIAPVVADRVAIVDRALINYRVGTGTSQCDSKTKHPEAAYAGIYSVVKRFKEMGIFESVKQSYLNVAIRLMREYFDSMTELNRVNMLYEKYREEIFPLLGAEDLPNDFFHDPRVGDWYRMIITEPLDEIIFAAARAGGGVMTTAPLRFQVPYERIKKNSRIVLVGRGLVGRYWYAQLLLSGHCEVVYWADTKESIPQNLIYDAVVQAR